jgi:hypothetical protein
MSCRTRWQINSRRSVCEYCDSSNFSDTGFCNNCGAPLIFNGENGWNPSKEAVHVPIALNTKIEGKQCYLCGDHAEEKQEEKNKAIDIMVRMMIMESSEMEKIKKFGEYLFDRTSKPSDMTLVKMSKAIQSNDNMMLPVMVNKFYYEESNFYGVKNGHICIQCAWKEFKSQLTEPEPEDTNLGDKIATSLGKMVSADMEGPDAPRWEKLEEAVLVKPTAEPTKEENEDWEEDWDEDEDWPDEDEQSEVKYYIGKDGMMRKR